MRRDEAARLNDGWNALVRGQDDEADETVRRLHALAAAIEPPPGLAVHLSAVPPQVETLSFRRLAPCVFWPARTLAARAAAVALVALVLVLALAPPWNRRPAGTPPPVPGLALATPDEVPNLDPGCDVAPRSREEVLALAAEPSLTIEPATPLFGDPLWEWAPEVTDQQRREVAAVVRRWFACGAPDQTLHRWALATDEFVRASVAEQAAKRGLSLADALSDLAREGVGPATGLRCTAPDLFAILSDGRFVYRIAFAGDALAPGSLVLESTGDGWRVALTEIDGVSSPLSASFGLNEPASDVFEVVGPCAIAFTGEAGTTPAASPAPGGAGCPVPPRRLEQVLELARTVRQIEAGRRAESFEPPMEPGSGPSLRDAARDATTTLRFWLACIGRDDLLRRWALTTDWYVARTLADHAAATGLGREAALADLADRPAALAGDPLCIAVDGALPDGRLALVVLTSGDPVAKRVVFRFEAGRWQIDDIGPAPPAADPADRPCGVPLAATPATASR